MNLTSNPRRAGALHPGNDESWRQAVADSGENQPRDAVRICRAPACSHAVHYNRALQGELGRGAALVSLRLDAASRLGLDPDQAHPEEVGHGGLSVVTLDDIEDALRGVKLANRAVHVQAGSAALPVMALLQAWMGESGQGGQLLRGAVLSDPMAEWLLRGTLPGGLSRACEGMATMTKSADKAGAALQTVGVQAALWGEAGASAAQEVAFGIAMAECYLRELAERRVPGVRAAPRFLFTFSLGGPVAVEWAKIVAARRMWAQVVGEAGGDPAVPMVWQGKVTEAAMLANAVTAAMAAGAECLHVTPDCGGDFLPAEMEQITGLAAEIENEAQGLRQEVERAGGLVTALVDGAPQDLVERTAGLPEASPTDGSEAAAEMNFALHRAREAATLRRGEGATRGREVLERLADNARANARTKMAALLEAFACGATLGDAARVLYQGGTAVPAIKALRLGRKKAGGA